MDKTNSIDLITYLDIAWLPPEEQEAYILQFTRIVLDGVLEELFAKLSKDDLAALENYLNLNPKTDDLLQHLMSEYQEFPKLCAKYLKTLNPTAASGS